MVSPTEVGHWDDPSYRVFFEVDDSAMEVKAEMLRLPAPELHPKVEVVRKRPSRS